MKLQSKRFLTRSRRRGLTLIEVVAAIAILGTLLVGVVLAKSRHTRQLALARTTTQAVRATDAMIAGWWCSIEGVPINDAGELPGADALRWRTRLVPNTAITQLGARVVRVEVLDADDPSRRARSSKEPILVVDLVVPDPEVETREKEKAKRDALEKKEKAGRQGGGDA